MTLPANPYLLVEFFLIQRHLVFPCRTSAEETVSDGNHTLRFLPRDKAWGFVFLSIPDADELIFKPSEVFSDSLGLINNKVF